MQSLDDYCESLADETPMGYSALDEYFTAYYDCRQHKRRTINAVEFELHYERNLVRLYNEVINGQYEIGQSICFYITRPKLREVFAANFRDRIIHHLVVRKLEPLFEKEFIYDNYNCRVNKGVLFGIKRLQEQTAEAVAEFGENLYYGKFDMTGFFMSINKDILWNMLESFISDKYDNEDKFSILNLTKMIVYNCPQHGCNMRGDCTLRDKLPPNKTLFACGDGLGIPIGNLSSQVFANYYLSAFDNEMKEQFKYYGRYVDDFYVIGTKEDVLRARAFAYTYLKRNMQIELSNNKVYVQPIRHGIKFIGSMIKMDRVYPGNRTISNIRERIHSLNKHISQEHAEDFMRSMNSYHGFLKHSKSYAILRNLYDLIDVRWWQFVEHNYYTKISVLRVPTETPTVPLP